MTQKSKWTNKNAQKYLYYKDTVGWAWKTQVGLTEYDYPIGIDITIVLVEPEAHRWDIDNVEKAILDGLTKIAYKNDKQIAETHTIIVGGDKDHVIVKIWEHEWTHYSSPSSAESQSLSSSS